MVGAVVAVAGTALLQTVSPVLTQAFSHALGIGIAGLSMVEAGLLGGKLVDYSAKRKDKIKANPMGWLYFSKGISLY
jgi:hypothetical protein